MAAAPRSNENASSPSDLAASGGDRLLVLEEGPVEREGNAEECWISLRLGRSVALLLLHHFAIATRGRGAGYFSSAPSPRSASFSFVQPRSASRRFKESRSPLLDTLPGSVGTWASELASSSSASSSGVLLSRGLD